MLEQHQRLVDGIHDSPTKAVVIVTGGGTGVFDLLLSRGNGSKTLLAGYVPYTSKETDALLGGKPDKYVSEETARALAMAAYQKALHLREEKEPVIGLACTASLQGVPSEREGRDHKVIIALQTEFRTTVFPYYFTAKNRYARRLPIDQRRAEEDFVSHKLIEIMAMACGLGLEGSGNWLSSDEHAKRDETNSALGCLLNGSRLKYVYHGKKISYPEGDVINEYGDFSNAVFISGSFNPLHEGHIEIAEYLAKKGLDVGFEICITNVDKPPLDFITCGDRFKQFTGRFLDDSKCNLINGVLDTEGLLYRVVFTNLPTFKEKSAIFKRARFAVGYDTAIRIMNPRYVGPIEDVLKAFQENGTYFYMFPREVPGMTREEVEAIISGLPGEIVREEFKYRSVSSSEIRKQEKENK